MASPQVLRLVDVGNIKDRLSMSGTPEDTVEAFYRFGTLLFSEIQQRGSEVDRKLTNALGWSIATLALLLNQYRSEHFGSYAWIAVVAAAIFSLGCALIALFAVRTRMWRAPSEKEWFNENLWGDPVTLKRYHILQILATHQTQAQNIKTKADCLGIIEIFLPISGAIILCVFLLS
jgi:hypothetical protein